MNVANKYSYPKTNNLRDANGHYVPASYGGVNLLAQLMLIIERERDRPSYTDEDRVLRAMALLPRAFIRERGNQGY